MASASYTNVSPSYNNFQLCLDLSSTANVAANKSTVTYDLYIKVVNATSNYRYNYGNSASFTLNGQTIISADNIGSIQCNNVPVGTRVATIASGSMEVAHNADGTKSIAYSASFRQTQSWNTAASVSGNFTLDTIARTSIVSVSATTVTAGSAVTVYTNRNSTSFTHTLQYKIGNGSYTTFGTSIENSLSWTVPTSIANSAPNGNSVSVTINCITYNGSTQIGTSTCSLTVNVPSYTIAAPTIALSDGKSRMSGFYIQGLSTLKIVTTAPSMNYGATLKSYNVTVTPPSGAALKYSTATAETGYLSLTGTWNVSVTVTDSRGKVSTARTGSITVTSYAAPRITGVSLIRTNTSGTAQFDGNSMKLTFTYQVTSIKSGSTEKNSCNARWRYKASSSSSYGGWTTVGTTVGTATAWSGVIASGALAAETAYNVEIWVGDYFQAVTYQINLSAAAIPFDLNATGTGMGLFSPADLDNAIHLGKVIYPSQGIGADTKLNKVFPLPNFHFNDLPGQSTSTPEYMKQLTIKICQSYKHAPWQSMWFGTATPNASGLCLIHIYDTNNVNSGTGLPSYSTGIYIPPGAGQIETFGCENYTFWYHHTYPNNLIDYNGTDSVAVSANAWTWTDGDATFNCNAGVWYAADAYAYYNANYPTDIALVYTNAGVTYPRILSRTTNNTVSSSITQILHTTAVFYTDSASTLRVAVRYDGAGTNNVNLKVRRL